MRVSNRIIPPSEERLREILRTSDPEASIYAFARRRVNGYMTGRRGRGLSESTSGLPGSIGTLWFCFGSLGSCVGSLWSSHVGLCISISGLAGSILGLPVFPFRVSLAPSWVSLVPFWVSLVFRGSGLQTSLVAERQPQGAEDLLHLHI